MTDERWLAFAIDVVLGLGVVAVVGAASRWGRPSWASLLERPLDTRLAPIAVGALTALFVAWLWGSLSAPAAIHDEAAYLLQARIFASGQLSAPAPLLSEFFEQYHVLVSPRLAPKYLPGHALVLLPGIWLGLPGLMPVLLAGVAGGLVFALARKLAGGSVAALTWLVWLTSPADNVWRCTYLSESTSTAVWLGTAWLLLRWFESGRSRDLVFVSLSMAWLAITRPLTAIAFAIPVAVVVLVGVYRRRAFAALATALVAGLVLIGIVPIWNAASTLDWRTTPYSEYSRVYFPYDKLGFGVDPTPALRPLPPDMVVYDAIFKRIHGAHTVQDLPRTAIERLAAVVLEFFALGAWRESLVVFFLVGLWKPSAPVYFGLASTLALFAVYLSYAHPLVWLIYYYEAHAFLAFVVALGLWRALVLVSNARLAPLATAALLLVGIVLGARDAVGTREIVQDGLSYHREFARAVAAIPEAKAVLFVRYSADHDPHLALVENSADAENERVWVVYDRGPIENARLLALAPERVPYYYDEASSRISRLMPIP